MKSLSTIMTASSGAMFLAIANTLLSKGHSFLFFGETEIPEELKK